MVYTSVCRKAVALALLTTFVASQATAGIWLGSQNCLRLGNNLPSGANQTSKKTTLKNQFATNNFNLLQEVMVTTEVANVKPSGFYSAVSGLKGKTSYKEAYGFVYNTSVSGGVDNYSNSTFDRPPSAMLAWTGSDYCWMVNYHAAFDSTPNATEIKALNQVYNNYRGKSGKNDVIIAGDFNRTATSSYFNNLKNAGCGNIQPNSKTSINSSGVYANPYDHFCWSSTYTSVSSVGLESIDPVYWVKNISDHVGIYCYVNY